MPRFSVLLPTHNRADVLPFAIRSVLAQSERDFELLIVGDGCTDETAAVVAQFDDARIRWFDLPKAPHFGYANRNVALKQAQGTLIAFAAHDDLLFPDHLALLSRRIEETGADWVYSRPLVASPEGAVIPLSGNLHNSDELDAFLHQRNFIPASCVVHRRTCLEACGYWPENIPTSADWHLWRRMIERGSRRNFAYEPLPTTLHFKAHWRKNLHPAPAALVATANRAVWWPAALKVRVGEHENEQAAICRALEDPAWIEQARRGVTLVVERLAREHTMGCLSRGHDPAEEIAALRYLLAYRGARFADVARHLKAAILAALGSDSAASVQPNGFVEEDYLEANPDVAEAMAKGKIPSAFDHWRRYGWREQRQLRHATIPQDRDTL
jgi:glycosyl transferase family 2